VGPLPLVNRLIRMISDTLLDAKPHFS